MIPEDEFIESGAGNLDQTDVEAIKNRILEEGDGWEPGVLQSFGSLSWRPELQRSNPPAVLHVHLAERLRSYMLERLQAARSAGHAVHLAMPLSHLYDESLIESLAEIEPHIHVIDPIRENTVRDPLNLLVCLSENGIQVSSDARRRIGNIALQLSRQSGGNKVRGQRFETLLVFLLSQIRDFDVVERNLRISAEELDAVIQNRATEGRVWATLGAPLILLEAKNWTKEGKGRVDQKEVSAFRVKMEGKRKSVRLGFLISASGFTGDAFDQELRFALGDLTIVFLGPEELEGWIDAEDGDQHLERLVRRAMLR